MSQNDLILEHLREGRGITAIEALGLYGVFRLAARIKDLRNAGHPIVSYKTHVSGGRAIARYELNEIGI